MKTNNNLLAFLRENLSVILIWLTLQHPAHAALELSANEPFYRCLSSQSGSFAQVYFRVEIDGIHILSRINVVLGYTDRWIKVQTNGVKITTLEENSWSVFSLNAPIIESEQLISVGISSVAEDTGYDGFVFPGFLDVKFPTGEKKRFMLECYPMPGRYWRD